jgi:regulator of protease activity HflC (stomatin/prohibitin superfamily)
LQKTTASNTLEQARHDYHLDDLATKRDLKEMEFKLQKEVAETKADLVRWVVGVGLLQITIIVGFC